MCGISGIIGAKNKSNLEFDLRSMNDLIYHRGPDAEGFYIHNNLGFGHRRLSILDLSEQGNQPMDYSHCTITYNGEIYNYIEIKNTLVSKGYSFRSDSDTEVILAAYTEWGVKCVQYFNGMWAFAIHDKKKDIVFLSRDRFGIKPLYFMEHAGTFYFGSEIKQLLYFIPNPKVNRQILFDYLYLSYHHHTNNTFFKGIQSLPHSHNVIYSIKDNSYSIDKYYNLKINPEYSKLSLENALQKHKELMSQSIRLRLRSDVKVGTCLSGGMDSSFIAASAAPIYKQKAKDNFTAITAKSIEKKTDESQYAKEIVDRYNLDWGTTKPSKKDFLESVDEVIKLQEEPFGSPSIIMQYFVMKKAKEKGCIVMLDGQGGDETLLGYDRYYATYVNQQKGLINKIKSSIEVSKNSKLSLKDVVLFNLYFNNKTIRKIRQIRRNKFIKKPYKKYFNNDLLSRITKKNSNIEELQHSEITKTQLQKLLKYEDRNSMYNSIEARVPFIDHNIVEFAISIPFEYKMFEGWTKYILRRNGTEILPNTITWRKNKFGFESPKDIWLSDKAYFLDQILKSPFINNFIDSKTLIKSKIDAITLWKLYNISVWANKFNVSF